MRPLLLCILDGVGINNNLKGNAYKLANTPNLDNLFNMYPNSMLEASGTEVGLPEGQMGNSEVGHSNIGAGRIVYQAIQKINNEIDNNNFYKKENLLEIINYVKNNNSRLHLMGLVSDGGVHSSLKHIQALIDICDSHNVEFYLHIFTDGRDTLPNSSLSYISKLNLKTGKIATIHGRYYAMDRDNRYDRIKKSYDVITGNSDTYYNSVEEAININYQNEITDEFIVPGIINKNGTLKENDGIILFNFRPDRNREIGSSLSNIDFKGFEINKTYKVLTMMPVSDEVICNNIYELDTLDNTLGEYVSKFNLKQLRIAETEKYAHVTYFFDGGKELELPNCDRMLIPSPKVATYDLAPEMSAIEITDKLIPIISNYDLIILNYANGDMVGHTGDLNAAIKAVEKLDVCIGRINEEINKLNGILIITADHGNCEEMIDENNNVLTSHTTNKVPFLINKDYKLKDGKLSDIAPTILKLLDLEIPIEMTGNVLIEKD
ncbi:MAG: 2,3-bisphosphoglycerate-independent phosphoglycerate mutase [Firmicutes bacterium]|nr:2,3-bisphosphoglycerate-independent phosphoglycerate mutase [Bacillota bacterium]